MKLLLIACMLCSYSVMADDEVIDVPTPASLPAPEAQGAPQVSPEQAQAMMEKLQKGQKMREDQNKMLEEMDAEE